MTTNGVVPLWESHEGPDRIAPVRTLERPLIQRVAGHAKIGEVDQGSRGGLLKIADYLSF